MLPIFLNCEPVSGYATNHTDAYLDDGSIDTIGYNCSLPHPEILPQIIDSFIISDTLNWVKVQGSFIATGNEKFITIGNFSDNLHTEHMISTWAVGPSSWYLIDDVSVIESDNIPFAGNDTAIHTGDSVFLGPHEIALPYTWYVQGNPTPIDSGGGIWVHPTSHYKLHSSPRPMWCYHLRYGNSVCVAGGCGECADGKCKGVAEPGERGPHP